MCSLQMLGTNEVSVFATNDLSGLAVALFGLEGLPWNWATWDAISVLPHLAHFGRALTERPSVLCADSEQAVWCQIFALQK